MNNLKNFLKVIQNEKLTISKRGGSPTIKSTQRNKIKREVEDKFLKDLREMLGDLVVVKKTESGVIIGLEHEDLMKVADASGEISFEINIKVKNLDYDIINKNIEYREDLELKALRLKEQKENKDRKIKRDNIRRAQEKLAIENKRASRS